MRLTRSLALVAVVSAGLAAVVGALYGTRDGLLTWLLLFALGGSVLAVAHLVARRPSRLGSLRRQFGLAGAIVAGQIVLAALVSAELMFVSHHDALFVVVLAVLSGVVAIRVAQVFSDHVLRDIDGLRETLSSVGDGLREPVARTSGDDELADLATAANAAIVKLAQSDAARKNLVAAVSHDLRTPITSLRLLAQAVDDEIVDAETQRRYLAQMATHVNVLSALIDDLFELSRLEAGELRWSIEQVRLAELVGESVEAMRPEAEAKRVRVEARLDAALGLTDADPEKLRRVLFNLLQNAIRHTPPDGSVTVLAEPNGQGVEIEVADTGDGIAPADRRRVFEPFFRGGSEAARTRAGAGLGLAISRAIVEAHGGRMWLEDAASGTRVRFSLPSQG